MMFAIAFLLLITGADTANAGPLFGAIGLLSGAAGFSGGITVFGLATSSLAFRLLATVALSALSQALAPKTKTSGIQTAVTTTGGVTPASFILGRYATAGAAAAPAMSHGKAGKVPNAYLTYVIDLGDVPGQTLLRLMIDDEYAEIGTVADPDYGLPVLGRFTRADGVSHAWVKYLDGSQTAADPMLLAKYAAYPERPWSADMVGAGICQAIVTFRYNTEIFTSLPGVRFEMGGIPLYDPRLDTSVGGAGTMRWATPSTWAGSDNCAVQIYNILRGITLPGGAVWGGEAAAADLPLDGWFAAMNECDLPITMADTTTQPQYRSGFEVMVDAEPAGVIEELLKGCAGSVAESGGVWTIHVGAPALPVYFFDDGTVIVSKPQDLDPFPGLADTYNGIHASYPEPASLWESKDAPPLYSATYEAADQGRQLVAALALPAVPYGDQVQRLMRAYIEEERRFARHVITLPPEALVLAPLDTVAWTSARNGYDAKLFEVVEVVDDLFTGLQQVSLRERDPADYSWSSSFELPSSPGSGALVVPAALAVPTFALAGITLFDAMAVARRPALKLSWDGTALDGVPAVEWEVRLNGSTVVTHRGSTHSVEAGEMVVADGILSATTYEARARLVIKRPRAWSSWATATTPTVLLGNGDVDFDVGVTSLFEAQNMFAIRDVATLPASGSRVGEKVFNRADGKLYEWTGTAWVLVYSGAAAADVAGQLTDAQIADIAAAKITGQMTNAQIADLAATKISGQLTDAQIADIASTKITGQMTNAQIADLAATKISGQLTDAQIADIAAAKITGQVVAAQIADATLTTAEFAASIKPVEVLAALPGAPHVAGRMVFLTTDSKLYRNTGSGWTAAVPAVDVTGQMTNAQIADLAATKISGQLTDAQIADIAAAKITGQITGTQITDSAISTPKISAGAITTEKIAAGAITAGEIAANAITSPAISAGAITTSKIAAGAITAGEIAANAITSPAISAGAITTSKIAAGAITATELAADTITAGQIAAGAINTAELAAGAVTASKLMVADFSKLFSATFTDPTELTEWVNFSGAGERTIITDALAIGGKAMQVGDNVGNDQAWLISTRKLAFDPTKLYRISASVRLQAGGGRVYLGWAGYLADGVTFCNIAGANLYGAQHYHTAVNSLPGVSYTAYVGYSKGYGATAGTAVVGTESAPGVFHPNVKFIAPLILVNYNGATGTMVVDSFEVEEVLPSTLIQSGAITTAKIAAGAITTGKIAAGAITAGEIAADAITTPAISAGAITTGKIAAGAITAGEIAANAITSPAISAGAITSDKIAANTITADDIAANTITGGLMAASGIITTSAQISDALITNAHINGVIQSDNYIFGTLGWKINKLGTAYFNNLITRNSLQLGAVSDTYEVIAAGPFTTNVTMMTLNLGAVVQPGHIFKRGLTFESYQPGSGTHTIILEARGKDPGGAWGSWYTVETFTPISHVWTYHSGSATLNGNLDDFEYRMVNTYSDQVRNIQLTVIEVTR